MRSLINDSELFAWTKKKKPSNPSNALKLSLLESTRSRIDRGSSKSTSPTWLQQSPNSFNAKLPRFASPSALRPNSSSKFLLYFFPSPTAPPPPSSGHFESASALRKYIDSRLSYDLFPLGKRARPIEARRGERRHRADKSRTRSRRRWRGSSRKSEC